MLLSSPSINNDDTHEVSTQQILSAVDAIQEEAISFLKTIVAIDSTLEKGEGKVQSTIYKHLVDVFGAAEKNTTNNSDAAGDNNDTDGAANSVADIAKKRKRKNLFQVERIPVKLDEIQNQRGFSPVDWAYSDDQKFDVVARYCYEDGRCNDSKDGDDEIGSKSKNGSGRALLLQGHVDVVPANESDGWTNPPFSPIIRNGKGEEIILSDNNDIKDDEKKCNASYFDNDARMYGRGAGDMKAGVVSAIYAFLALRRLGYVPKGNVTICTVVEEECTGNGALAASAEKNALVVPSQQTAIIIPEPFPFLVTAQLGVLWFRAAVTGKPCHVLQTSAGSNAIEGAYQLYSALKILEEAYNEPRGNAHPAYRGMDHPVNFNLGKIEGGNWASSVPSSCCFEARVGFFPGVVIEDVKRDLETALHEKAKELGLGLEISYRGFNAEGAVLLSEYADGENKHPQQQTGQEEGVGGKKKSLQREFVELLQQCHKLASSPSSEDEGYSINCNNNSSSSVSHNNKNKTTELPLIPITCTTDARFYSSLYHDPNDVVVTCYGPEATNIHGVDESVSLKSMRDVTASIALFIRDWCGLVKEEVGR